MNRDDVIRIAQEAGLVRFEGGELEAYGIAKASLDDHSRACWSIADEQRLTRFAVLVAATERKKVAQWMMWRGYATGHGDTTEDLLLELDWQIAENWNRAFFNGVKTEREACAKVCDELYWPWHIGDNSGPKECAKAIRARGQA